MSCQKLLTRCWNRTGVGFRLGFERECHLLQQNVCSRSFCFFFQYCSVAVRAMPPEKNLDTSFCMRNFQRTIKMVSAEQVFTLQIVYHCPCCQPQARHTSLRRRTSHCTDKWCGFAAVKSFIKAGSLDSMREGHQIKTVTLTFLPKHPRIRVRENHLY